MKPFEVSVILRSKCIVVNSNNKVLVIRRSETDTRRPLTWEPPGGIVEQGEDPAVTAQRETFEEAGLKVKDLRLFSVTTSTNKRYMITFFYYSKDIDSDVSLSFEHDDFKWIDNEGLQNLDIPELSKQTLIEFNSTRT